MEVVGIASGIGVPFSRNSPHVVLSSIPRKIKERRSSKVVHRVLRRVHRDFTPLIVSTWHASYSGKNTVISRNCAQHNVEVKNFTVRELDD